MRVMYLCDAVRTPIGRFGDRSPRCAPTIWPLTDQSVDGEHRVYWTEVDEVFFGCAKKAGEDNRTGRAGAGCWRACPKRAGYGPELNRLCESGSRGGRLPRPANSNRPKSISQ